MGCCERLFCCQRARVGDEGSDPLLSKDDETYAESITKPAAGSENKAGGDAKKSDTGPSRKARSRARGNKEGNPSLRVSWIDDAGDGGGSAASLAKVLMEDGEEVAQDRDADAPGDVLSDAVAHAERRKRRQTGFGMVSVPVEDVEDDEDEVGEEAAPDRASAAASAERRKRRQTGFVRGGLDAGDEDGGSGGEDEAGGEEEALERGRGSDGADDTESVPEGPTPSTGGVPPGAESPDDGAGVVADDAPATPSDVSPRGRRSTWGGTRTSRGPPLLATRSERRMSNVSMREMGLDLGELDLDDDAYDAMLEAALDKR